MVLNRIAVILSSFNAAHQDVTKALVKWRVVDLESQKSSLASRCPSRGCFVSNKLRKHLTVKLKFYKMNLFCFFQLWRPVTATLYFPVYPNTGFLFLVNLYFLYHYSTRLETGETAVLRGLHTSSDTHRMVFCPCYLFSCFVFQERLMADPQTMSSCCSSTGSALLYPLTLFC